MTTSPPPAVAAAPIGRRAGACAIDIAVAYGIGVAFAGVTIGIALGVGAAADPRTFVLALGLAVAAGWAGMLAWAVVCTAMQAGSGSVGQRALDLRLLRAEGPVAVGFWRALWRNIVWMLSCAIVVGWFTPLFDASPRRQGWHDRAGGAIVVHMRGTDAASRAASTGAVIAPRQFARAPGPAGAAAVRPEPQPWFLDGAAGGMRTPTPSLPAPAYAAPARAVPAPTYAAAAGAVAVAPPSAAPTALIPRVAGPATRPVATSPGGVDETRTTITVPPPAQRAALFDDAPVIAVLTWDDGTRMAVYGRTRYGRNPAVEPGIVSVPVRDETLSLSKTHFEIGGDAGGAWVADRYSTNGTVLVRDGGRHPLVAGTPTLLRAGDRLELGDRSAIVGTGS